MRIVDTHTHAWGPDTDDLPWETAVLPPEWLGPYRDEDLLEDMNRAGIEESVIVTTPLYGRGPNANEYTLRSIEAHPDRFYGVGLMDFFDDDPDAVRKRFREIVDYSQMLGVRMHATMAYEAIPTDVNRTTDWILDEQLEPIWDEAANRDVSIFIFPKAQQLSMIERLADVHPDVTLVIDHMAWPDETTAPDEAPWADFEALAEHGNVYVKVSSLPRSAEHDWPYSDLHPYVRNLIDWFGADRLMLGSDYPWMNRWADYEKCLSWIEAADFLSRNDCAHLRHRTFENIYNR
jgi:L-fuconolactonase